LTGAPTQPPTEPLTRQHAREAFSCGRPELDRYLRQQARKEQEQDVAVCWVLPDPQQPNQIRGYYTVSAYSVKLVDLPNDVKRRLPKYQDMPAALLGRLAVDSRHQGQHLGEHLLLDAMKRVLALSKELGTLVLVVDAKDEQAAAFYAKYDFIPFPTQPLRLFLPIKTIAQLFTVEDEEGEQRQQAAQAP
jgi:ribosomal protein S18 acetylase RimI-like enzyme